MFFDIDVERRIGDRQVHGRIMADAGIVALFGPSGVGKTSILNMVAGLLRPDRGRITIAGETLFDSATGVDIPAARRHCGYIFQDARLFPHRSVRANLRYGITRRAEDNSAPLSFDAIVDLLGIAPLLGRWPSSLSGGEAQRVAIGRALLSGPRFLLMDEPLSSLDEARRRAIIDLILRLHDGTRIPILFVSHDRQDVAALTQTVIDIRG